MADQPPIENAMDQAIDRFGRLVRDPNRFTSLIAAGAAVATPSVVIAIVGEVTGTRGGAAIMKTLALAGSLVGEGAAMGVTVLGIGAVAVGWSVKSLFGARRSAGRP